MNGFIHMIPSSIIGTEFYLKEVLKKKLNLYMEVIN